MDIDLYGFRSRWPSIRHRSNAPAPAAAPARLITLDGVFGAQTARRADPNRVRDLLSQLITAIEGKPLSAFVPMAETVPLLLGLTPNNLAAFDEFLGAFIGTVVGDLGRIVTPGSVTSPSDSISANRRQLAAGALGVKRSASVVRGRPRSATKYDDLVAFFSEGKTLAAVLTDADDGLPPAVAEVVGAMLTAISNNLKSGSPAAAREAGADAATLIVAVHDAFFTEATAERGTRGGRVARTHTGGLSGMVRVKKAPRTSRAKIKFVEVDGEDVPVEDVVIAGKKFVKRRLRKV